MASVRRQSQRPTLQVRVCNDLVTPSTVVRDLGIYLDSDQRRRAIEALEARAPPPDSVATLVNSSSKKYHSVRNFERKHWENSPCDTMHSDLMAVL